jgi:hypothetical protein
MIFRDWRTTELKPSFTVKQNECGLCSGIDPIKLSVYKAQPYFTSFVMEFANRSCFMWLLYRRLRSVRFVYTGKWNLLLKSVICRNLDDTLCLPYSAYISYAVWAAVSG